MRVIAAIALGLGIAAFVGATAWSRGDHGGGGGRPYSDAEILNVQSGDEAKITELREQEITQLRIALGRRAPTNRRADLYLRLAEIYIEGYRATYLLEGRVHEKRLEKNQEDKFIDHSHSHPYLSHGIQACNDILKLGIAYAKLDEVYYFLGFNWGELDRSKESLRYFDLLTRKYPGSPFVGEAYRELGDAAFDDHQFRKAQGYFELAAKRDLKDSRPRLLHKLAWTYYRTKQFDRAVATMKEAIAESGKSGEKFLSLREEALRDMAMFMTETGQVEEAVGYFQSVAGDKSFYPKVLEKLGRQYERNVEPVKATQVYESLLKTHPDDEAAFRVRVKLVDLDLRRGHYKEALARLQGAKLYTKGEPETVTAAQNLRAMVRRTATEHHEAFRKNGTRSALAVAEDYYTAYINLFLAQDDPRKETPEIQMYLADVKRENGKAKEASELYRRVLDSKDKRYAKEAGALWTASLADAIKKAVQGGQKPSPEGEPSKLERDFVDAADELEDALGEMPEGREAALKAAQVLAGYKGSQKEAVKRARKIVDKWPKSAQGLTAARLWLQIYADRLPQGPAAEIEKSDAAGDLKDAMKELRENAALTQADQDAGGKLKAMMAEQDGRFKVGAIAKEEREKDYAGAAKGYEAYATESAGRELAEKAYANATAAYARVPDYESVDRVSAAWMKRFPGSPRAIDAVRAAATGALIQGRFEQTASLFEKLGKTGHDGDALETAARINEGNGNSNRARELWTGFLNQYRSSPHHWSVLLALARSQEADKLDSEASKTYRACMGGPPEFAAECGARLGDLYLRSQDLAEARKIFKAVAAQKAKGALSPFVGYARYRIAELMEREAKFETLQLPESQLKKALGQRLDFLEPLSKAYLSAVEAGGPWGVASLDRLASWALNFADDVDNIPPPPSADSTGIASFKKNIEGVSGPLRRKAVDTWNQAYAKAVGAEILSPALPEIVDRLADARVANPSRAQGYRGRFRLGGIPSDGGADGKSGALEKTRDRLVKNAQDGSAWVDYGNLLWGQGKPGLAKIAYDRALGLDRRNAAALNNRGVVIASGTGEEDWLSVAEADELFRDALKQDDFYVAAKMNHAALLNYYRIFSRAKTLWEQINVKAPSADSHDGLAVALLGLGGAGADAEFEKAADAGAAKGRFVRIYHDAVKSAPSGAAGAEKCLSRLGDLDEGALSGFEKGSAEHLKRTCTIWKSEKQQ